MTTIAELVKDFIQQVGQWQDITIEPHRFGGSEFKLENVEVGHIHSSGMIDIPFTRRIREQLLMEHLAEPHHLLPETGWISYYIRQDKDVQQALWLMRLSYVQKSISRSRRSPERLAELQAELEKLNVSENLRAVV